MPVREPETYKTGADQGSSMGESERWCNNTKTNKILVHVLPVF